MDWQMMEAISTGVAAFLGTGAVLFAGCQLRETWRKRQLEFTERKLDELNSIESKEGLRIAYQKAPSKLSDLGDREQAKLVKVLEGMHSFGLLVERGFADKKLAIEAHRGKFIRCWSKPRPCICYERNVRGKYGEGIEYLAKEAYKYQRKKYSRNQWVKLDGVICEIDPEGSC